MTIPRRFPSLFSSFHFVSYNLRLTIFARFSLTWLLAGGKNWTNVIVEAAMRNTDPSIVGTQKGSTGIAFRVAPDSKNYYLYKINPFCGSSQLLLVTDGVVAARINRGPMNLLLNGQFKGAKDILSSVQYMGCYRNIGTHIMTHHETSPMTHSACFALARDRGNIYFGLQHPESARGVVKSGETEVYENTAKCLLSNHMGTMEEVDDSHCHGGRASRFG